MSIFPEGFFAAADHAETAFGDVEKTGQAFLPLPKQFGAMDQHQRADFAPGDHRGGGDGLAEGRWCTQYSDVMFQKILECRFLVFPEGAGERDGDPVSR